jgi:TRAP-type C4-dicarboxylate transport system substrate-binding protein
MEISMSGGIYASLSTYLQRLLPQMVREYSDTHHAAIRAAGVEAWKEFEAAGMQVTRLSEEDAWRFRAAVIPLWRKWAHADADAARLFAFHVAAMADPAVGLLTPQDIRTFDLAA